MTHGSNKVSLSIDITKKQRSILEQQLKTPYPPANEGIWLKPYQVSNHGIRQRLLLPRVRFSRASTLNPKPPLQPKP